MQQRPFASMYARKKRPRTCKYRALTVKKCCLLCTFAVCSGLVSTLGMPKGTKSLRYEKDAVEKPQYFLSSALGDSSEKAKCRVFVPSAEELSYDVMTVDGSFYGRTGNRIATYKEVFRFALLTGCHVKIRRDLLSGWDSGWSLWKNTAVSSNPHEKHSLQCMHKDHEYWYFHRLIRLNSTAQHSLQTSPTNYTRQCTMTHKLHTAITNSVDAHADCAANDAMMQYFGANLTHMFGSRCPRESYAVVHVRGGDTTQGHYASDGSYRSTTIENNYGPHPTSFYTAAVRMMLQRWHNVTVICEDLTNPSCDTLQSISSVVPQLHVMLSSNLKDDLFTLNCAKEVAVARGSFQHAVLLRNHGRHVHDFRTRPIHATLDCDTVLAGLTATWHFIEDAEEAALYCKNIQGDIWNNSALHRHFVNRHYDTEHVTCLSHVVQQKL